MWPIVLAGGLILAVLSLTKKAPALPAHEQWQIAFKLIPPLSDNPDKEDAFRNAITTAYTRGGNRVVDFRMTDARDVVTLVVEYEKSPTFKVGSSFTTSAGQSVTLLSAVKL